MSREGTRLLARWQSVFRRHELNAGFGTASYGHWNNVTIQFDCDSFKYLVNGALAYSEGNTFNPTKFSETIMQAYNFDSSFGPNKGPDYSVNWSSPVPEPSSALLAGSGLAALALLRRR